MVGEHALDAGRDADRHGHVERLDVHLDVGSGGRVAQRAGPVDVAHGGHDPDAGPGESDGRVQPDPVDVPVTRATCRSSIGPASQTGQPPVVGVTRGVLGSEGVNDDAGSGQVRAPREGHRPGLSRKGSGGPPHDVMEAFLKAYYRHVAPEDVVDRNDVDMYGALASHWKLATNRPQGTAKVRVSTPGQNEQGWSAVGHSVVEVVTDDMPFLVDSLTMELSRQVRDVHVVIHPNFDVVRDITGALQQVRPVADGEPRPKGGVGARVLDARRDRPGPRGRRHR